MWTLHLQVTLLGCCPVLIRFRVLVPQGASW